MSYYAKVIVVALWAMLTLGLSNIAWASIVVDGTRVIYKAGKKEVTVKITNNNTAPVLLQSWIDSGEENTPMASTGVPFVITPPINRVDASKGQTLRISYLGSPVLPSDRESAFWLNILEVPAKVKDTAENNSRLSVAFRTRIKLFYRPDGLPGNSMLAAENLKWELKNNGLSMRNPSSYFVTVSTINYKNGGKNYEMEGKMVAPGATTFYPFNNVKIDNLSKVTYSIVSDYGGVHEYKIIR